MPVTFLFRPPKGDAHAPPVEVLFHEERVRIGRGSACELRLPHASVSELHAVARQVDGAWVLADENSRNGTWVNGCRLVAGVDRVLRDGDMVRVGSFWMEVRLTRCSPARLSTRDMALEIVSRMLDVAVPTVLVVEGPDCDERLALAEETRPYTIGRSSRCDMHLMDLGVSREHVRLRRDGARVLVQDAGGKSGVLLGDAAIPTGQTLAWSPSLAMRIGSTVLALQLPPALEAVADGVAAEQHEAPPNEPEPPRELASAASTPEASATTTGAPTKPATTPRVPATPAPIGGADVAAQALSPPVATLRRLKASDVAVRAMVLLLVVLVVVSVGVCIWLLLA